MAQITFVDKPAPQSTSPAPSGQDAKARAIAALMGSGTGQAQNPQVLDQTRISPEESLAVKPQAIDNTEQTDSNEAATPHNGTCIPPHNGACIPPHNGTCNPPYLRHPTP